MSEYLRRIPGVPDRCDEPVPEQEAEARRNYELALQDGRQEDADTFREQIGEQEAEARRLAENYSDSLLVYEGTPAGPVGEPTHVQLPVADFVRLAKAEQERDALRRGKKLADARIEELDGERYKAEQELARWLAWSSGQYPDGSPGDVISASADGTIVLDDGITTWNPLRACAYFEQRVRELSEELRREARR